MAEIARPLFWVAAGGAAGAVSHALAQRTAHPAAMSGLSLVTAAAIYRLADPRGMRGPVRDRELAGVGATTLIGLASLLAPHRAGRRILAAGWLAHAGFDAVHHRNDSSRLPGWYPAMCAGFDVVVAAKLMRDGHR